MRFGHPDGELFALMSNLIYDRLSDEVDLRGRRVELMSESASLPDRGREIQRFPVSSEHDPTWPGAQSSASLNSSRTSSLLPVPTPTVVFLESLNVPILGTRIHHVVSLQHVQRGGRAYLIPVCRAALNH